MFVFVKVQKNKILFINFNGKGYGDNPKYVCDYLRENYPGLDLVWLSKTRDNFPSGVRVVKYGSLRSLYEQATAAVWAYNIRAFFRIPKKRGQYFIQLWHGSIGFKLLEADAVLPKSYVKKAKYDAKVTDLMVSNSAMQTMNFRKSFWYSGKILEGGLPRNDALYRFIHEHDTQKSVTKKVKEYFTLPESAYCILYAPTFRDNDSISYIDFDFQEILRSCSRAQNNNCYILVRFHPNVMLNSDTIQYSHQIINASLYPDMQELLAVSDMLITDYSSSILDCILLEKPCVMYANDLESYSVTRGLTELYFKLPYPIARTKEELYSEVEKASGSFNKNAVLKFKNDYWKPVFDGKSSMRAGEEIIKYIAES